MTAQVSDSLRYRDRTFSLVGVKGSELFDPSAHGLKPGGSIDSACWRGFVCTYGVSDGGLFLEKLGIELPQEQKQAVKDGKGHPLFGKLPTYARRLTRRVLYENLHEPMPFSGGMLLATDFIEQLYVHMGFHPAWKFKEVHELLFEEGRLVEEIDGSEAMARARERIAASGLEPLKPAGMREVDTWIEKTFRLDY
ncbi:hypothetical protein ACLESO_12170 [Pyxidicoccus sp. 3LG]